MYVRTNMHGCIQYAMPFRNCAVCGSHIYVRKHCMRSTTQKYTTYIHTYICMRIHTDVRKRQRQYELENAMADKRHAAISHESQGKVEAAIYSVHTYVCVYVQSEYQWAGIMYNNKRMKNEKKTSGKA